MKDGSTHLAHKAGHAVDLDTGYPSNETLVEMREYDIRTYISEPDRGPRNWENKPEERDAVYAFEGDTKIYSKGCWCMWQDTNRV